MFTKVDELINFKVKGEIMPDTKQTKSTTAKASGNTEFKFCSGDFEEMSRMMRKFCSGEDETFDCGKMMQKMCCSTDKPGDQQ